MSINNKINTLGNLIDDFDDKHKNTNEEVSKIKNIVKDTNSELLNMKESFIKEISINNKMEFDNIKQLINSRTIENNKNVNKNKNNKINVK